MQTTRSLNAFIKLCKSRFGDDCIHIVDDDAFIAVDDIIVHARSDETAERVALWVDLGWPANDFVTTLEHIATDYVAHRGHETPFVMGVERGAELAVLGCSVEAAMIEQDGVFDLIADLAHEASHVAAEIEKARFDALLAFEKGLDAEAEILRS